MSSPEGMAALTQVYGAMPARLSLQESWLNDFQAAKFPGQEINWQPVIASISYADNPPHEGWIPNISESNARINEFWALMSNEPGLDLDAEIDKMLADLNVLFQVQSE